MTEPTIRVRLEQHRHFYIHNDIANGALYFKTKIDERMANADRDGIAFDIMACLTLLAFEVEAKINFLGFKLRAAEWRERAPALEKVQTVLELASEI